MKSSFPMCAIGDVCVVIAGQHIASNLYNQEGLGIPYLTGPADFGDVKPTISKWTNSPKVFASIQDVLLTVKGNGVGKSNLGVDAAIGRQLMALRPSRKIEQSYLFHFVKAHEKYFFGLAQGATVPGISKSDVAQACIPLPPLEEQRRIAAILDKADSVQRKRQEAIRLTEELLRSRFLEMFGDPVRNPKGWKVKPLGEVSESKLGKMRWKENITGVNLVPYLGNSHVRWRSFDLSNLPEMDFTESELEKLDLRNGDLIVCEGGEVGRCAIW
ncbi:MAG: restriction endonuclease subunit S, partial [Cyanobacteria bacterium P01_F01_bin.86]